VDRQEIEVYSDPSNFAVVRMPGRSFPGCVVQGDSLHILSQLANRVCELARTAGSEELVDEANDLAEQLAGRLAHYESVLKAHGLALPYHMRP
jgi:hypothetical protein